MLDICHLRSDVISELFWSLMPNNEHTGRATAVHAVLVKAEVNLRGAAEDDRNKRVT